MTFENGIKFKEDRGRTSRDLNHTRTGTRERSPVREREGSCHRRCEWSFTRGDPGGRATSSLPFCLGDLLLSHLAGQTQLGACCQRSPQSQSPGPIAELHAGCGLGFWSKRSITSTMKNSNFNREVTWMLVYIRCVFCNKLYIIWLYI